MTHLIMSRILFSSGVLCFCLMITLAVLGKEEDDRSNDILEISNIDPYELKAGSTIGKLNDLLVERLKSSNPDENLDIILDKLKSDYRKKGVEKKEIQVKRLFLALRTLTGEHQCDYYSYLVLSKSLTAIGFGTLSIEGKKKVTRRIDKIVEYFMDLHVKQCRQVYFEKFDEIKKNLEETIIKRSDLLFEDAIKRITSDREKKNIGLSYVERLFNAVSGKTYMTFSFRLEDIYKALEKLVRGDPDEEYIRPIKDQKTGLMALMRDKFAKLYNEYVLKTCSHITQKLGQEIFDPAYLDMEIDSRLLENRVDYYETWLKYILCYRHGGFEMRYDSLVVYVEKLRQSTTR